MFLAPAQHRFTAAGLAQDGIIDATSDAVSVDDRAKEIDLQVYTEVVRIVQMVRPETIHIFTHSGIDAPEESSSGLFHNKDYYYSALKRNAAVDHYVETIIPINIEPGLLSFKVESVLTAHVCKDFKYIKDVAEKKLEWDTVDRCQLQTRGRRLL